MTILKLSELLIKLMEKKGVNPKAEIYCTTVNGKNVIFCEYKVNQNVVEIRESDDPHSSFLRTEEKFEEL